MTGTQVNVVTYNDLNDGDFYLEDGKVSLRHNLDTSSDERMDKLEKLLDNAVVFVNTSNNATIGGIFDVKPTRSQTPIHPYTHFIADGIWVNSEDNVRRVARILAPDYSDSHDGQHIQE